MSTPPKDPDVAAAYDRWAATYDVDPNRTRDLAAAVLRQSDLQLAGRDVIEVGCGTGRNTVWLADRAASVQAMDFSEGMLRQARAHVVSPHVRFLQHDIRSAWPIADASADIVLAMLVLEHIEHLDPVLTEAARVLRPDGELFLCELHPVRQLLGRQARFTDPRTGETERIAAFLHDVSDYVNGGVQAGCALLRLGEWRDAGAARTDPPRLISARFRKYASTGARRDGGSFADEA
jgi:malonyl-CoA O-methyltransferase